MNMMPNSPDYGSKRVKLIFNPLAGAGAGSPTELVDVIHEMQAWKLVPEVFLIEPDCDLPGMIQDALDSGIEMVAVCGGDGTISSVATALLGTRATLGIIPGGTRNNVALSLGVPTDVPAAVALLRTGRPSKVDVGVVSFGEAATPFVEVCSVGLTSALFPSADDIQHGDLTRIGDFLATLVGSPASEIRLLLDDEKEISSQGHVVLVSNMPYVGPSYRIGAGASASDGLLDVLFFADQSKLDLLGYAIRAAGIGETDDHRVRHFRVRSVDIEAKPPMPVMADGIPLGEGRVRIEVRPGALTIMGL